MNRTSPFAAAFVCALAAGCFKPQDALHGKCQTDSECQAGSRCDRTQDPPVCVTASCDPPCDSNSVCDSQSLSCKAVTAPSVAVTSPAASTFIGSRFQASATARAPGGVTGVTFQVKNAAGDVIGTGAGTGAPGSPDFAATLTLNPGV